MAANVYECMFLLDPTKVAGDVPSAAKQLHGLLEKHQCEVLASRPWDERRLSYPIKGHKKGLYYLTYFRSEGKTLTELERDFQLNEAILRTLVLKVDPKLEETMLTLARDEHALALQVAQPETAEEGGAPGEERGEDSRPPRRGRRPVEDTGDKD